MREQIVFFISFFIIFILSLTILIQQAYYYRKIIKDARTDLLKISKRFNKLKKWIFKIGYFIIDKETMQIDFF